MKLWMLVFAFVLSPLALAQEPVLLHFKNHRIEARFTEGPMVNGESKMDLRILDGVDDVVADPEVSLVVSLFMPEHGHGSTETVVVKSGPGSYEVAEMYFLMGGKWRVDVEMSRVGGLAERQSFDVEVGDSH